MFRSEFAKRIVMTVLSVVMSRLNRISAEQVDVKHGNDECASYRHFARDFECICWREEAMSLVTIPLERAVRGASSSMFFDENVTMAACVSRLKIGRDASV